MPAQTGFGFDFRPEASAERAEKGAPSEALCSQAKATPASVHPQ